AHTSLSAGSVRALQPAHFARYSATRCSSRGDSRSSRLVGNNTGVFRLKLPLATNAIGAGRQAQRGMLLVLHTTARAFDVDVPDIEAAWDTPCQALVAKHRDAAIDAMRMARQFSFGEQVGPVTADSRQAA